MVILICFYQKFIEQLLIKHISHKIVAAIVFF